jgi:flavin reductase (DIM6/NTAB) family NADH-FMN oxidoreductase RutF
MPPTGQPDKRGTNLMSVDPIAFRKALGCFATGVTIITTTDAANQPVGITANSFTSLSLDPPLVLFCLDRKSASFAAFHKNRHFAVNILRDSQQELSRTFARSVPDKWTGVPFETWDTGCPILPDSLAALECDVDEIIEGGDHVILIGKVRRIRMEEGDCQPLVYFRGKYAGVVAGS